jgi:hypothetical protein
MRSTTPSSLIQSSGLPQPPATALLYHHPSLSPSSGGMSASAMITSSSSGMASSQLPTATTMQPPYTIGMTQSILFSYSLMI